MYKYIYIFHYKGARLALTLRYLATGDNLHSLAYAFRTGHSTASTIVKEVSVAIFEALSTEYLKEPTTAQWKIIAQEFDEKWNFPNCCGALDGKHISIVCPANSGIKIVF